MDQETMRKAITAHRGGLDGASDGQIRLIWNSLDAKTQQHYLKSVKTTEPKVTERKTNDVPISDEPKTDMEGKSRKRR